MFEGPLLNPSNTYKKIPQNVLNFFSSTFMKNPFDTYSRFFHKNIHVIVFFLTASFFNCSVLTKFCPMCVEMPYYGGVINPTLLMSQNVAKFYSPSEPENHIKICVFCWLIFVMILECFKLFWPLVLSLWVGVQHIKKNCAIIFTAGWQQNVHRILQGLIIQFHPCLKS